MTDQLALAAGTIEVTPEQRAQALHLIRTWRQGIGDIRAFRAAGVEGTRGQIGRLLASDPELADDIARARGRAPELIRDEIRRRAIEGVEEPVFGSLGHQLGSGVVGSKRVYSDKLLEMMAKAHLPEYREKVEPTGGDAPNPVEVDGGRITGISDVFELARAVGVGLGEGLRAGATRDALPAAPPLLPDPPDS